MKWINLMFNPNLMKTPMWKRALQLLPYVAIVAALAFGAIAFGQWRTISRLEDRIQTLYDEKQADHLKWMEKFMEFESKIMSKVEQGKEESKVIKVDIGKTIKEFNRDVKAAKEIGNASDSIAALHDAWSK